MNFGFRHLKRQIRGAGSPDKIRVLAQLDCELLPAHIEAVRIPSSVDVTFSFRELVDLSFEEIQSLERCCMALAGFGVRASFADLPNHVLAKLHVLRFPGLPERLVHDDLRD